MSSFFSKAVYSPRHVLTAIACFGVTLLCGAALAGDATAGDAVQFNRDVRPILSQNCFRCHGPDEGQRKADLRLDRKDGITDMFPPGSLDDSEAWRRITSDDPDERMPPPDSRLALSPAQRETIRRWIEQGAKWEGHWAYIPPKRPPVPEVRHRDRVANPIDAFILARLEEQGVEPVELADRATLIRRLSLDLVGLPPSPEELDAFVADDSPEAWERLVDRLLASPHFGERMGLYWLDLVRYADSVGYHKDSHQDCWLYRDYVVQAFNENKRFDQFVKEQLAGDLLKGSKFEEYQWKVASGFNRMNQTTSEGGAQPKEYLAIYSADRVRNTAAILLGSTMGCTQCHDHKYDPFTTRDFYSFAAFFADLQERGVGLPEQTPMPTRGQLVRWQELEGELAVEKAAMEKVVASEQAVESEKHAASEKSGATDEDARREENSKGPVESDDATKAIRDRIKSLETQLAAVTDQKSWAKTMITRSGKPRTIRILPRGNWLDESGPEVQPAIPAFLGTLDVKDRRATRLDLADWITSRDNPLTARVLVNRLWRMLMGEGIARTLDDLGSQGQWPTHAELLDWLAVELIDSGWNVKHIMKLIAMSDAYRRSSACPDALRRRDPENRLFARQTSFRLPAELVRDNALAISGLLSEKMGGRSVRPYQPANYWYRLYNQGKYVQDHGEDLYRRGLYTYWRRSFWHPSLRAFDAPAREECVAERPRSNTPAQSLVLLNDPTYVEAARVLATGMIEHGGVSASDRITWAYRRAVARTPSSEETAALAQLLGKQRERYQADEKSAGELIHIGEWPVPNDIPPAELAAWTSVARVILNLHETITRN